MPNYRRNYVPGGTYFFTLVTFKRRKHFNASNKLDHLYSTIRRVQRSKPFELLAYCLLPDHIHLLMTLPENDCNYSLRIREIKRLTTLWMNNELTAAVDPIWQDKYWEHTISGDRDMQVHFNYIHYNPVKHGLTETFDGWKWSSFRDYLDESDNNFDMPDLLKFDKSQGDFGE